MSDEQPASQPTRWRGKAPQTPEQAAEKVQPLLGKLSFFEGRIQSNQRYIGHALWLPRNILSRATVATGATWKAGAVGSCRSYTLRKSESW